MEVKTVRFSLTVTRRSWLAELLHKIWEWLTSLW